MSFDYLIEKQFSSCVRLDGEFHFRLHGRHFDSHCFRHFVLVLNTEYRNNPLTVFSVDCPVTQHMSVQGSRNRTTSSAVTLALCEIDIG